MAQPPITPISLPRISGSDLENKGVTGLPDTPNLSAPEMQRKFDEIGREVIPPIVNNLSSAAEGYINDLYEKERVNEDHISSIGTLLIDTEKRVDKAEGDIRILNDACDNLEENKVDKIPGKGLSTNDYTNTDKANLSTSFENSREALSNSNIALTNSNEAFQKAQDAQTSVATFGTKLEDVRKRAEKSLTSVIAEDENKKEYESYSIETLDYDRITGKTTVSAITTHLVIPNADEKFRKNLMYGNIEGTSPLTAKTLSGATELSLKGRCEQSGIPTPDAPIPIEYAHATDSTNLWNGKDYLNAYIVSTSDSIIEDSNSCIVWAECEPNKTYTVSKKAGQRFRVACTTTKPVPQSKIYGLITDDNASSITITTPSNAKYIVAFVYNSLRDEGITGNDMRRTVMLNEGTSALPYEQFYKATKVESVGKNLFNKNSISLGKVLTDNGEINNATYGTSYVSDYISVNGGDTITFSYVRKETVCYSRICQYDAEKKFISMLSKDTDTNNGSKVYTVNLSENARYVLVSSTSVADNIQVEIGTSATTYAPYQRTELPLPCDLLGLPNAQDELKEGFVTRRVYTETLDTPYGVYSEDGKKWARYYISQRPKVNGTGGSYWSENPMFDKFRTHNGGYADMSVGDAKIQLSGGGAKECLVCVPASVNNVADAIAYCGSFRVVYELETQTSAYADRIELPTYNEQTTFNADYCDISADVAQNGLDVIDERTKEVYAEEETLIGTYLGKPLYRKVIHTRTPITVKTDGLVYEGIKKTTHNVINMYGSIDSGEYTNPINMFAGGDYFISTWVWNYGIQMRVGVSLYADKPCEIVVEYTKASASGRSAEPMMLAEEGAE